MIRRSAAAALAASLSLAVTGLVAAPGGAVTGRSTHTTNALVKGIGTYVSYNCQSPTQWSIDATNQMAAIKALGATSVALTYPLYTNTITSNDVYEQSECDTIFQSPSPAELAIVVGIAHSDGLSVFLRPTLSQTLLQEQNPLYWHGAITPSNVALWFTNYYATLEPYLAMAQTNHVESFALSSELSSMNLYSNWANLITTAKKVYKGSLVITDSWASNGNIKSWTGASLGVDTYRPVTKATGTWSPAQLLASWDTTLKSIPVKNFSTVTMDEVGIPAQVGAYQGPNGSDYPLTNNPLSQLVQVNWFTMACAFAKQQATPGLYFWGPIMTYNSGLLPTTTDSTYTSNLQPEGQVAIMNCFGKGTSPTLTSISPKTGSHAGGTQVTITGNNFIGTFNVFFGKTAATSFAVESNTKIVATAPAASKGVQAITVQTEAGTSAAVGASKFTFK